MDKLTAEIIKEQMIGETAGHMANVPLNPVMYSIFYAYANGDVYNNKDNNFKEFIRELADALEVESKRK